MICNGLVPRWQTRQPSVGCLLRLLSSAHPRRQTLLLIILFHSALQVYSSCAHSPTLNEPAHLVAGLSHLEFGRFDLYRVNPPLVRTIAALPVAFMGYEYDWGGFYEKPGARPVFEMGHYFAECNQERIVAQIALSRIACLPFSILGAVICYLWARDLGGVRSGLAAAVLWSSSPSVLGHASLITADAHSSAVGVASAWLFWRWLNERQWRNVCLAGIVLGAALLSKTTLLVLLPVYPSIWLYCRLRQAHAGVAAAMRSELIMLASILFIALYVLRRAPAIRS